MPSAGGAGTVSRREERSRGLSGFSSLGKKTRADDSAWLIGLNVITALEMFTYFKNF